MTIPWLDELADDFRGMVEEFPDGRFTDALKARRIMALIKIAKEAESVSWADFDGEWFGVRHVIDAVEEAEKVE